MKFEFAVNVTCPAAAKVEANTLEEARQEIRLGRFIVIAVEDEDATASENDRLNAADDLEA
jgi:hypothetical protein